MFETATTFMTSADNRKRKNGVIHKKEIHAMIQVMVYLKKKVVFYVDYV